MINTQKNGGVSPQERLISSRKAIIRFMTKGYEQPSNEQVDLDQEDYQGKRSSESAGHHWQNIKHAIKVWWQHHPAQLALDLAVPVLGKYAEKKPLQLLGIAAGAGAVIVLIRPWRLVSVTGLALTALKSSKVSALVLSLLTTRSRANTNYTD